MSAQLIMSKFVSPGTLYREHGVPPKIILEPPLAFQHAQHYFSWLEKFQVKVSVLRYAGRHFSVQHILQGDQINISSRQAWASLPGMYLLEAELLHKLSHQQPLCSTTSYFYISPNPPQEVQRLLKKHNAIKLLRESDCHDTAFQAIWSSQPYASWRTRRPSPRWYGGLFDRHKPMSSPKKGGETHLDEQDVNRINVGDGKAILLMNPQTVQSTTAKLRRYQVQDEFKIPIPAGLQSGRYEIAGIQWIEEKKRFYLWYSCCIPRYIKQGLSCRLRITDVVSDSPK